MKRLPDTGQNGDYTNTPGEDSDFRINMPFFTVNGNGTVTDTVTSLMWQQNDGGEMTWEQAKAYCDSLSVGGYTDWRLPNSHELFSINDFGKKNPALNTEVFTKTAAEYWWSSETFVSDANRVWVTNSGGGIGPHPKSETISAGGTKRIHVRAVRDQASPPSVAAHFTDNDNETVSDNLTGFVWQQYCLEDSLTWEQALRAADTLTVGGYSDWRLPNMRELQSLNSEKRTAPSVELLYYPCVGAKDKLWSSTTLLAQDNNTAWMLQADVGIVTYLPKTSKLKVLCVRGGVQQTTEVQESDVNLGGSIYPNPTTSTLHFPSPVEVHIFTTIGEEVLHQKNCTLLDVSSLASGMYILVRHTEQGRSTTTFVKW